MTDFSTRRTRNSSRCPSLPVPPAGALVYADPDSPGGFCTEPLVAWGVFEVTVKPCMGSRARERADGRRIFGVVYESGLGLQPADDCGNFWKYLPPGAPDRTPAEAAAELETQRKYEAARARHRSTRLAS